MFLTYINILYSYIFIYTRLSGYFDSLENTDTKNTNEDASSTMIEGSIQTFNKPHSAHSQPRSAVQYDEKGLEITLKGVPVIQSSASNYE